MVQSTEGMSKNGGSYSSLLAVWDHTLLFPLLEDKLLHKIGVLKQLNAE